MNKMSILKTGFNRTGIKSEGNTTEMSKYRVESCLYLKLIICSLWWCFFTLVLISKKYCIKIEPWLLGFGAPLKFCAPNECLAHLTLFLELEQY